MLLFFLSFSYWCHNLTGLKLIDRTLPIPTISATTEHVIEKF